MWMCSLCWLPVAENHNFWQILTWGLLYRSPFTDEGQIWCAEADRTPTLTCQISSECVHCVGFRWPKTTIFGKVPFTDESQIWCAEADWTSTRSRGPSVLSSVPKFTPIGATCRPCGAKNLKIALSKLNNRRFALRTMLPVNYGDLPAVRTIWMHMHRNGYLGAYSQKSDTTVQFRDLIS